MATVNDKTYYLILSMMKILLKNFVLNSTLCCVALVLHSTFLFKYLRRGETTPHKIEWGAS